MSRVERLDQKDQEERRAHQRGERSRQPADRTPGKAEGDVQTVDEALENQKRKS